MVFHRPRFTSFLGLCLLAGSVSAAAQPSPVSVKARAIARRIVQAERAQEPAPSPLLSEVTITGARYFTEADIAAFLKLRAGSRLPAAPQALADELRRRYVDRGY